MAVVLERSFKENGHEMTEKENIVLKAEDWNALERFDRNTGNILKYDKQTGQLDHASRKIIRETNIIKRLIDTGMVLPGGWLTSKGLKECETRQALLNQRNGLDQETGSGDNGTQQVNKLLNPQAEKFLKSLWANDMIKPVDLKPVIIQNDIDHAIENDGVQKVRGKNYENKIPARSSHAVLYDENNIDDNLITFLRPHSFEAEQFKILRTHIFFPLTGKIPRIVAVTSSVPGEGKSFVAANLAVSIAKEIERFVLLIDCDLRRPSVHKYFGFKDDLPGLSEHLSQKTELSRLLLQTCVDKLTLLPAGSMVENPSELLSSEQMVSMLKEVSQRYKDRLIVLDTTPVTITAEAVTLTHYVDGVLLVVRKGYTLKNHLKDLINIIDREKVIGTVLNDVNMGSLNQYEYKKYIKKYYHSKTDKVKSGEK